MDWYVFSEHPCSALSNEFSHKRQTVCPRDAECDECAERPSGNTHQRREHRTPENNAERNQEHNIERNNKNDKKRGQENEYCSVTDAAIPQHKSDVALVPMHAIGNQDKSNDKNNTREELLFGSERHANHAYMVLHYIREVDMFFISWLDTVWLFGTKIQQKYSEEGGACYEKHFVRAGSPVFSGDPESVQRSVAVL